MTISISEKVIKVYYILDEGNTKTLSYTVEYYKDGIKQEDDTITKEEVVQVLDPDTISIEKNKSNFKRKNNHKINKIEVKIEIVFSYTFLKNKAMMSLFFNAYSAK